MFQSLRLRLRPNLSALTLELLRSGHSLFPFAFRLQQAVHSVLSMSLKPLSETRRTALFISRFITLLAS